MADYKTITLTGDEVAVELSGRHCQIRNLGSEMIYASVNPGIIPDADVLSRLDDTHVKILIL